MSRLTDDQILDRMVDALDTFTDRVDELAADLDLTPARQPRRQMVEHLRRVTGRQIQHIFDEREPRA